MPTIFGFHHLSLTVRDLDLSAGWYQDVLGLQFDADVQGEGFRRKRFRSSEGLILTLTQHDDHSGETFNERRTGMDHVAFHVAEEDIDALKRRFEEMGVIHSEIQKQGQGPPMITFRDPDNIQLEVFGGLNR